MIGSFCTYWFFLSFEMKMVMLYSLLFCEYVQFFLTLFLLIVLHSITIKRRRGSFSNPFSAEELFCLSDRTRYIRVSRDGVSSRLVSCPSCLWLF